MSSNQKNESALILAPDFPEIFQMLKHSLDPGRMHGFFQQIDEHFVIDVVARSETSLTYLKLFRFYFFPGILHPPGKREEGHFPICPVLDRRRAWTSR